MIPAQAFRAKPGFSLVEVVLVLALLVVIGAMTMPILTGTMARSELRNAGEVIRVALQRARLTAIETGQVHLFRYELKGQQFHTISVSDLLDAGKAEEKMSKGAKENTSVVESFRLRFDRLSGDVMFASGQVAPSQQLASMYSAALGQGWSNPIVFQPDGSCNDASILLANENGSTIRVTIRGMTGTAGLGDVGKEEIK
jgi:prepilin-type N-terminal cleavage/methylation domain-containing protein